MGTSDVLAASVFHSKKIESVYHASQTSFLCTHGVTAFLLLVLLPFKNRIISLSYVRNFFTPCAMSCLFCLENINATNSIKFSPSTRLARRVTVVTETCSWKWSKSSSYLRSMYRVYSLLRPFFVTLKQEPRAPFLFGVFPSSSDEEGNSSELLDPYSLSLLSLSALSPFTGPCFGMSRVISYFSSISTRISMRNERSRIFP